MKKSFSVSIILPVLNAGAVLEPCLRSIREQDYPEKKIEIILVDGGSVDDTLKIANRYKCRVVKNVLKTAEAGKAVGVKKARGEIIALIDSDNIFPDVKWLRRMVEPFKNSEIVASEPIEYTYRRSDPYLTRYFAMLGMNDPICLFLGNYDRMSFVTGRWTGLSFYEEDQGGYLKVRLDHLPIPTVGANGFLIRREVLMAAGIKDYLFDIDVLIKLIKQEGVIQIAKVKTGIIHTFVEDSPRKFFRKQLRRVNDMMFHRAEKSREIDWERQFITEIIWFQVQCLLVIPIIMQMLKGYLRRPDWAWIFHPVACYSTWVIYLYGWVKGKVVPRESDRDEWRQ